MSDSVGLGWNGGKVSSSRFGVHLYICVYLILNLDFRSFWVYFGFSLLHEFMQSVKLKEEFNERNKISREAY